MTSIVGLLCSDGIVVGADGSATFGSAGGVRTIEQPYSDKVQIINDDMIIATTGQVGLAQRFQAVAESVSAARIAKPISYAEVAKQLTAKTIKDFQETNVMRPVGLTAFAAYGVGDHPWLCEFASAADFQPEFKKTNGLWFTSAGSGQSITDPFLALFRKIFWPDGPPNLQEGIFAALWALQHACDVNPGGIKEPIYMAVLARDPSNGNRFRARLLDEKELEEQKNMVADATKHFSTFRDILQGKGKQEAPKAPAA